MSTEAEDVLEVALKLDPSVRADIAARLIESLHTTSEECEDTWEQEIRARITDLDSGASVTVPWSEARARIRGTND